jgi:hypothetical protein
VWATDQHPEWLGHWRFSDAGNGNYTVRNTGSKKCLDASSTILYQFTCDGTTDQLFDMRYWADTGQIQLRSVRRGTCIGDDNSWKWGSNLVTTSSCSGGESRITDLP